MTEAKRYHEAMQAYFKANNTEVEAADKQKFMLESDPRSERMVTGVLATTVYEAPKPRRRRRVQ